MVSFCFADGFVDICRWKRGIDGQRERFDNELVSRLMDLSMNENAICIRT